tara:strand:+ start:230 stop:475 length:246 start_codon:yes stop_codon:yes gene_type:complete
MRAPQKSLANWTKQKWGTKSGKPSTQGSKATGERYLPEAAIKALSNQEYAATTAAKRKAKRAGRQVSKQPKKIASKAARFR